MEKLSYVKFLINTATFIFVVHLMAENWGYEDGTSRKLVKECWCLMLYDYFNANLFNVG